MAQSSLCPPSVPLAGVQTGSTGELALEHRALGREHQKKKEKKEERNLRKYLQCGWEGAEYISNQKETLWPPLQFFVFLSPMPTSGFFFGPPILALGRRNTNNPIQK